MKNHFCNDVDGIILSVGDAVVVLDTEDLEGSPMTIRGQILSVTELVDGESNLVRFKGWSGESYEFFAHRVLKLTT